MIYIYIYIYFFFFLHVDDKKTACEVKVIRKSKGEYECVMCHNVFDRYYNGVRHFDRFHVNIDNKQCCSKCIFIFIIYYLLSQRVTLICLCTLFMRLECLFISDLIARQIIKNNVITRSVTALYFFMKLSYTLHEYATNAICSPDQKLT